MIGVDLTDPNGTSLAVFSETLLYRTRQILDGNFTEYDDVAEEMVRRFPDLQADLDEPVELWERLDLRRFILNDLLPRMQNGVTEENCREWIRAIRTRIIGDC